MQTRQTKYAAYATVYILVILAVLVVANFLANRYNKSYDATANKRFTLSDQTKKVVGDLKQDVTISYFDRANGMQGAKDLLDRYQNLSPKVHIQYVDLLKNPTLARAENVTREGEAVVTVGARREDAKTFDEEGVTGALIRALKGGEREVCVVSGHGEHRLDDSSQGDGFSGFQTIVTNETTTKFKASICCRRRKCPPIAPCWWWPAQPAITSSPKWTPSRNTSKAADARSSCWILR